VSLTTGKLLRRGQNEKKKEGVGGKGGALSVPGGGEKRKRDNVPREKQAFGNAGGSGRVTLGPQ